MKIFQYSEGIQTQNCKQFTLTYLLDAQKTFAILKILPSVMSGLGQLS